MHSIKLIPKPTMESSSTHRKNSITDIIHTDVIIIINTVRVKDNDKLLIRKTIKITIIQKGGTKVHSLHLTRLLPIYRIHTLTHTKKSQKQRTRNMYGC